MNSNKWFYQLLSIAIIYLCLGFALGISKQPQGEYIKGAVIVDMTNFEMYPINTEKEICEFVNNVMQPGMNYLILAENRKEFHETTQPKIFEVVAREKPEWDGKATMAITGMENPDSSMYNYTSTGIATTRFYIVTNEMREREGRVMRYFVQEGDTLMSIAEKFHNNISELKRINEIQDANGITAGQIIYVVNAKR